MKKSIPILLLFITIAFSYTFSKSVGATNGDEKLAIIYTNQGNIKIKRNSADNHRRKIFFAQIGSSEPQLSIGADICYIFVI